MKKSLVFSVLAALAAAGFAGEGLGVADPRSPRVRTDAERNATTLNVGFRRIGTISPKSAREVGPSNWSTDAGSVDRDFTDFEKFKSYLPQLGIRRIRVQSGWAKCERTKGVLDVDWLDRIVDWCNKNGMEVLLELSYGNPIYPGGGGAGLRDGIPNTSEGLAAWDRWVGFLAGHFKGRVREWAMWNEPDVENANAPEAIVAFNVRSARILRHCIPDARIHGLSLAQNSPEYLETCLKLFGDDVKLFDTFIYHGYLNNPDRSYLNVERQKAVVAKYAPHAVLRQGENGAPSEWLDRFALNGHPWSEVSQAKFALRRMLGDLGHDVESGLFCFVDIHYGPPTFPLRFSNRKGYLMTNTRHEVVRIRRVYYAVQNAVSLFAPSLTRVREPQMSLTDRTVSLYEYRTKEDIPLVTFWSHGTVAFDRVNTWDAAEPTARILNDAPTDSFETRGLTFSWAGDRPFADPVWIDVFTGAVYAFPPDRQVIHSEGVVFAEVPVYDSPCVLTERAAVDMVPYETK